MLWTLSMSCFLCWQQYNDITGASDSSEQCFSTMLEELKGEPHFHKEWITAKADCQDTEGLDCYFMPVTLSHRAYNLFVGS
ncbi:hypothetical protein FKM82_025719 [Ascaphus truei]